jgi:hypothetical protein
VSSGIQSHTPKRSSPSSTAWRSRCGEPSHLRDTTRTTFSIAIRDSHSTESTTRADTSLPSKSAPSVDFGRGVLYRTDDHHTRIQAQ